MIFSLGHHQLGALVDRIVRPVPVNDHAIDATADHIINLPLDLRGIGGAVADIHVVRPSEPQQQMGINFRRRARIQQRVNVNLAHIARASVGVRLSRKTIRCTGVIGGLSGQRCVRHHVRGVGRTKGRHCKDEYCNCTTFTTHRVLRSGIAEGLHTLWPRQGKARLPVDFLLLA